MFGAIKLPIIWHIDIKSNFKSLFNLWEQINSLHHFLKQFDGLIWIYFLEVTKLTFIFPSMVFFRTPLDLFIFFRYSNLLKWRKYFRALMPVMIWLTEETKIVDFFHLFLENYLLLNYFISLLKIAMYFKWFFDVGPLKQIKDRNFLCSYANCTFFIHKELKKVEKTIIFLYRLKFTSNSFKGNNFLP